MNWAGVILSHKENRFAVVLYFEFSNQKVARMNCMKAIFNYFENRYRVVYVFRFLKSKLVEIGKISFQRYEKSLYLLSLFLSSVVLRKPDPRA